MSNPIVARELLGVLRTRRAAALQVALFALFAAVLVLRWPTDAHVGVSGEQAQAVFRVFGYGLLALVVLFVPVVPATSVVREKKSGTLALLLNSPMRPVSIYFGKLVGALGYSLLLLSLSIPAATACYAMGGGVTLGDTAALYGLLLVAAVQFTAIALFVSTAARSADSALRLTYGCVLAVALAGPALYLFFQGQSGVAAEIATGLRMLSPVPPVMERLRQGGVGSQGILSESAVASWYVAAALATTALLAAATVLRLNQKLFDRSRSSGVMTEERTAVQRAARRAVFVVDPQRRRSGIGPLTNPVMMKEFRCRKFGRIHWLLRLVAACALASLGLTYLTTAGTLDWGVETVGGILVLLQTALILLVTPSLAAVLITSELETGGWQLLQTTPLSTGTILRGKLMSVVWTLGLILLATLPGYVVMVFIKPAMSQQVSRVVVCLLVTALFSLALSACVGSFFRRTAAATMTAYGLLLALCGGTLLVWMARSALFGRPAVNAALTLNPVAAALSVIEAPGFEDYELVPANWWILGAASAALLIALTVRTRHLAKPR